MVECICAWIFLILGLIGKDSRLLIAAGMFAIALHLGDMKKKG